MPYPNTSVPSDLFGTTRARRQEVARLRRWGREGLPIGISREEFLYRVRLVTDDLLQSIAESEPGREGVTLRTWTRLVARFLELAEVFGEHAGYVPRKWRRKSRRKP